MSAHDFADDVQSEAQPLLLAGARFSPLERIEELWHPFLGNRLPLIRDLYDCVIGDARSSDDDRA
jgi:hypothetical protein